MSRFLHVANGTSTTMTIEAAGLPGAVSIWADPLHDGPVPGNLTDEELVDVRARQLSDADSFAATVHVLTEWRTVIQQHDAYDELVLWYEHDLFDQLNIIQLLSWIRAQLPVTKPVSLICIGSFPGRPTFKGLGELTTQELAPLLDTRQPVDEAQYALARRAWQAFREPTPEPIDDLRQTDTSALPYLAAALGRFLQEYPWTTDGLSRTERRLLQLAEAGPIGLAAAFPRMHDGEKAYYVSDGSFTDAIETLSHTSTPLIVHTASDTQDERVLAGSVSLTDAGRNVLAGKLDRVVTFGIDRWLGGVHLRRDNLWRWDDAAQAVRRVPH